MKKLSFLIVLFFIFFIGCSNNQSSTKEAALYVIEHTEDFQELVQYFSLESFGLLNPDDSSIYESQPKIVMEEQFVHQAIYKTKDGGYKLVLLSDKNPPKILTTITIK